jgi:hypothetical protein
MKCAACGSKKQVMVYSFVEGMEGETYPFCARCGADAVSSGTYEARTDLLERLLALDSYCTYGPSYNQNVASSVSDSRLFLERGEHRAAERYLLTAEMRAGMMTFKEWERATAALEGKLAV